MDEANVLKIVVLNSDSGRKLNLYVRKDRLAAFQEALLRDRGSIFHPASNMPGLSWAAILGLDAIFDHRPQSFPARDIVKFLADETNPGEGAAPIKPHEVEAALERFAHAFPPDVSEDA
jgi:hypothetical protein